ANPGLTLLFRCLTLLGSQAVVIGVSACAALTLAVRGRREEALLIVLAMAGAEVLEYLLKIGIQRPRPEPFFGVRLPGSYSFPSGHALLSSCCYAPLAALGSGSLRWIATVALVLAIGFSRVYLGVHYPTDVIAGYVAAMVWMPVVVAVHARLVRM